MTFQVTVRGTTPPVITQLADISDAATCGEAAQVFFAVEVSDDCDRVVPTCIPSSGSLFPVGSTNVTCTAQDSAGNAATPMTFQVTVAGDDTPPGLIAPTNPTGDAGNCGDSAEVMFNATSTDDCQPVSVLCIPTSGSSFQLGSTAVECTAADPSGNTAKVNFDVTVTGGDNVAPVIAELADINDVTTCGVTAQVSFVVEASDACDGPVTPTCVPPSGCLFPVGSTNVTCTAQDSAGNAATPMTFQVTVTGDTTPPAFNATLENKTADAGCGDFAQVSFEAVATDGCGSLHVSCSPPSLSLFPVGSTRVQCTATDASGNAATENFEVTVSKGVEPPSFGPSSDVEVHSPYCRAMRVKFAVPSTGGCGAGAECFPASGSLFRLGKTQVTCTVSNDAGSAETSFNVHVSCDAPPYRHRWRGRAGRT
ncbi:unnamed protein product [Symbiodinium sp. CCMP2456]|nr:unnamed protein product [Symbiodinium sp. CCMP2456]